MEIEYLHASKFGNGSTVAGEFKRLMSARGVDVDVHHIREVSPTSCHPLTCTSSAHRDAWVGRSGPCVAS